MKILNFGSLNIDYVYKVDRFLVPGETKMSEAFHTYCGGKGLNQSIACAKAGSEVWHAGFIGEDGGMLKEQLEQNSVNTSLLRTVKGRNGHAIIQVDGAGQNCILLYGGTNRQLTEAYIDDALQRGEPGDIVLLQNETNLTGYIIDQAAAKGLRVAFNTAPMDERVTACRLDKISWLIANEIEGAQLAGCDSQEEDRILDILASRYPHTGVLLTLGKRGACYQAMGKRTRFGIYDGPVVDTTAAGDTFTGYFLDGMLRGMDVTETLRQATAASALCVGKPGASDSIPLRSAVEEALRNGRLREIK